MKTIFFALIIFISLFISCSTETTINKDDNFLGAKRGGCADGLPPDGIIQTENSDTVFYYVKDNHLFIYLGYQATCCILYDYKSEIKQDVIEIELEEVSNEPCDCICWYEFTFEFQNLEKKEYDYTIKIQNYLVFSGKIDLRE
ncbi:MAG: hypothetical protein V1779_01685 [bacterium]